MREFESIRQAGEGGSAPCIREMTPAEGINSSCGFSRVFVAEAKPERMAIEVKLFQPALDQCCERKLIAHERPLPHSGGGAPASASVILRPSRPLLVARDKGLQDWIMLKLPRVQAHQVGWIDVVDADDLKRRSFSDGLRGDDRRSFLVRSLDFSRAVLIHAAHQCTNRTDPCGPSLEKPDRSWCKRPCSDRREAATVDVVGGGRLLGWCVHSGPP